MILLIDQNEQATSPTRVKALKTVFPDATITQLVVGDINATTPHGLLACELKTANDFLNSISDGRVFDQVARMLEHARFASLIVYGSLIYDDSDHVIADGRKSDWPGTSVREVIRIVQGAGCLYEHVKTNAYARTVQEVIAHVSKDSHHIYTKKPHLTLDTLDPRIQWLSMIPGIGPKRAKDWLDFVSNEENSGRLCDALSIGTLFKDYPSKSLPRGFGPKTAQKITDFLELTFEEHLQVIPPF